MIAAWLVSLASIGIFLVGLRITGLAGVVRGFFKYAYQGLWAMTDAQLPLDEKEQAVRQAGISLFFSAWSLVLRVAGAIAASFLPVYLADRLLIADDRDVIGLMMRLDYMAIVSLALLALMWATSKSWRFPDTAGDRFSYSMAERVLHMMAFANPSLQRLAARFDDGLFRLFGRDSDSRPPIFITSLPRGGTTPLLNALCDLPLIASHTYRDMPFITAPFLWSRLAGGSRKKGEGVERAHEDGLRIDLDSPEAFDEVYWKIYWPDKYPEQRIALWQADDLRSEPLLRMRNCFQKIAHVRGRPGARYISKNNANLARLRIIPKAFPGAQVIVPVRRPAPHAASLFRQHRNFLGKQSSDEFIQRYMRDIGHLEFGLLHRPIGFDDLSAAALGPDSPDYWLAYWIAAFREVLRNLSVCHIVLQDDLRANANQCMGKLLAKLGVEEVDLDFTPHFRREPDEADRTAFSPVLLEVADALYAEIARSAQ